MKSERETKTDVFFSGFIGTVLGLSVMTVLISIMDPGGLDVAMRVTKPLFIFTAAYFVVLVPFLIKQMKDKQ